MGARFAAIAEVCVASAIVLSVAALGGAADFAAIPHALLSCAALLFAFLSAKNEPLRIPRFALVFAAGAAACALQLIPLPLPLLSLASPEAAELARFNLEPLGLSTTRPISLEAAATARELARALNYAALVTAAALLSKNRATRRRLLAVVAVLGASVAVIACVHALVQMDELFGVYRFSSTPPLITPFGNPNHLAGFLTVSATVTLGLFLELRGPPVRMALALAYLAQAAVCMFSGSRAGIVFFALAQVSLAALAFRARSQREELINARVLAAAVVAGALCVAAYVGWERLQGEYESTSSVEKVRESKVKMWPQFARSAAFYSRLGMGRGAFELGHQRHQLQPSYYSFTHPENQLLQLWAELGMLLAMVLVGLSLWAFGALFLREEPALTDFAVLTATAAVALHNLFDFSFELLAVPTALAVLLGAVSRRGDEAKAVSFAGGKAFAAIGVTLLLVLVGAFRGRHTFPRADEAMRAALLANPSAKAAEQAALPLIDQHPADSVLYSAVGLAYANDRAADPRTALAWLNRGLYLSPWHGPSHHAVARALLRAGKRHQAFGEYRLALESYGVPLHALIGEALRAAKTSDELVRSMPRNGSFIQTMTALSAGVKDPKLVADALQTLTPEVEPAKARIPLFVQLAQYRRGFGDTKGALQALDQAQALKPEDASVSLVRAEMLSGAGNSDEALALLESELTKFPGDFRLHLTIAAHHLAKDPGKALIALGRARAFADTPDQQFQLATQEARAYQASDRPARALQSAEAAVHLAPANPWARYLVADLHAQLGHFSEARRWLKEGMALDSEAGAKAAFDARDARWSAEAARIVELRDKALLKEAP